jgi:hypothetical protein
MSERRTSDGQRFPSIRADARARKAAEGTIRFPARLPASTSSSDMGHNQT